MPETRVIETVYDQQGNIIEEITAEISDEQLYQKELEREFNEAHTKAIQALKNWDSLTLQQKDAILKNLTKWALWKDGCLKFGVL